MSKNQNGFALLEAVLIFIIVAMLAGVGWYVWSSNKKANDSLSSANAVNSSAAPKYMSIKTYDDCLKSKTSTTNKKVFPNTCTSKTGKKFTDPNPYADWKTYTSTTGKYTLKYPANWRADVCEPSATDLTLYIGPSKASSVICGSEHFSQILVVSTLSVPTASEQTLGSNYMDQTSKKVTVGGVSGTRISGKLKTAEEGPSSLAVGTLTVRYYFLAPGRSYILIYVQSPTGDYSADNLDVFDSMTQNTLKFTK